MFAETRVTIVKFRSPHRFWIRETRNTETLANYENELHKDLAKSKSVEPELGDLVAIYDTGILRRARVMKINRSRYKCELLDHPDVIVVDHVYKLPEKYAEIPPMIHLASLYDVVAVQKVLNVETSDIDQTTSTQFTSSCIRHIEEMLKKSTETFFVMQYPVNNVLCGNILLKIDAKVIDLIQNLIEKNWVTKNRELFLEILGYSGELELNQITPPKGNNVQCLEGVGRACTRRTQKAEKQIVPVTDRQNFVKEWIGALDSNPSTLEDDSEPVQGDNSSAQSISDISDISDHIIKQRQNALKSHETTSEIHNVTSTQKKTKNRLTTSEIMDRLSGRKSHDGSDISSSSSSNLQQLNVSQSSPMLKKEDSETKIRRPDQSQNAAKNKLTPSRLSASEVRKLLMEKEGKCEAKKVVTHIREKEPSNHEILRSENLKTKPINLTNNLKTVQSTSTEGSKDVLKQPVLSQGIKNSFSLKEINNMRTQNRLVKSSTTTNVDLTKTCNTANSKPIGFEAQQIFKPQTTKHLTEITLLQAGEDSTTDTSSYYKASKRMEYQTSSDSKYKPRDHRKIMKFKKNIPKGKCDDLTSSDTSSSEKESNIKDSETTSSSAEVKEETPSDDEEFKGVVLKNNIHSFCKCASCIKWLDKDEDETVFVGEDKKTDFEVFKGTPQPLIKKGNESDAITQLIVRKRVGREKATKIEKDMAPSILVHGPGHIPTPVSDIKTLPFCASVHRALRECGIKKVFEMQMYVWPALMRSMNACIVNSSGTGKTLSYLPPLVSFIMQKQERYPFLPREPGPIGVILCEGVNRAEETYETLTRFLYSTRKRVNTYLLVPPINQKEFKYLKSADILVTTPKILVRILNSRQINLKRLMHLVVEDIELILERTAAEFYKFLRAIQTMLNNRVYVNSVQIVTTSKRWTKPLEAFVKQLATLPIICIGSHLESVMYGKANIKMHFVKCEKKKSDIAGLLKEDEHALKTLIVCNTDDEVSELTKYLQVQGVSAIGLTESMLREEIEEQENMWMRTPDMKNSALVCTDMLLHMQLSVTTARMLIHYSLPETSWTAFARRFKSVLDVHDSPFDTKFCKANACRVHIFVDEACNKQFPRLYYFLKQLGTTLPEKFTQFCKQLEESEEQNKIESLRRVCKRLKLLGKCDKFRCKKRHTFSPELDISPDIPKSGQIKFKILHAEDVTHYYIRLLEHTDTERNVHAIANYDKFVTTDLKIAVESNKLSAMNVAVGDQYAYFDPECAVYRRCKVLRIVSVHNITESPHEVKVKFLDDGIVKNISASLLFELPTQYIEFPPQSIDARLVNVVPLEGDTKWNRRTMSKLDKLLKDYQSRYPDSYCRGTIALQVGGTVYLSDIKIEQYLLGMHETVTLLNIKKKLIEMDVVDVDETVLVNLRKVWVESGFELPNYEMKPLPKRISKVAQVKPTWAFMECSPDAYNQVYFSYGVSPDKFYVRLAKHDEFFVSLQEHIQEAIRRPFYPEITHLTAGHCYLAKNPDDEGYGRVIVQSIEDDFVSCFFVDFGDSAKVHRDDLKFLSDELIQKLPFQAIECSMYGITSVFDEWPVDAVDILYTYTLIPDTDMYRDLHANVIRTEISMFQNTKYFVALVDNLTGNMTVLNKIIVDCGFAKDKFDEKLEDVVLPELKIPDDKEEEEEDEPSMVPCIKLDNLQDFDLPDDFNDDVETSLLEGDGFDCYIQGFRAFMKQITKQKFATTAKNDVTCSKEKVPASVDVPYIPMKALPPVNYRTPNVLWHQDNKLIKLEIFVPNIKEYQLHVLRLRNLVFHATINSEDYKLNFCLYNSVCSSIQHTTCGTTVRVTITKIKEEEWPRLTSSKVKLRNVKYDLTKLKLDEDEKKKKRRFLELDDGLEDDDTDDEFGPTYIVQGSDSDESDDSHCYDDMGQ